MFGAPHRSTCSQLASTLSCPFLLPHPGSPGGLRGSVSPSLGQPGRLRVSTLSSCQTGGGQSQGDSQSLHDSGRPSLTGEEVGRQPPPPTDRTTSRAALVDLLLLQPHFNRFHQGVHELNLHVWRLSSVSSESQDFCKELLLRCPAVSGPPLPVCTRQSECSSVVGVVEGALLRSTSLFL